MNRDTYRTILEYYKTRLNKILGSEDKTEKERLDELKNLADEIDDLIDNGNTYVKEPREYPKPRFNERRY